MKNLKSDIKQLGFVLLLALFALPLHGVAQYGIDGVVFGASHQLKWAISEKPRLKNIMEGQDKLIITNTVLALSQAKMLDMKKIEYKSLSKADNSILESTLILQAIEATNDLVKVQIQTFEFVDGYPEIEAVIIPSETDLITESYFLIEDIYISIKEGETNLMSSADRLLLMKHIVKELKKLTELAVDILLQANRLVEIEKLLLDDGEITPIPLNEVLNEIENEIKTIIND